jgi:hypothetical protein
VLRQARSSCMKLIVAVLLTVALAFGSPCRATKADLRSVSGMRDGFRVLLIFTPSLADGRLAAQRAIMAEIAVEAARRDLLLVQVDPMTVIGAHDDGDKLRRRFHVPVLTYHAILLDKDARVLREAVGPMQGAAILHAIDTAPRHQIERPGTHRASASWTRDRTRR